MSTYNLCIIKPNKDAFSETFIQEHINRLAGNKKVIYGGAFPVYDHEGKFLIKSKLGLLSYLFQKRILKKKSIGVRTKALSAYLQAQHIDVVFAEFGMVGAMVTQACQLAKVPLVIHFHGADVHHRPTVAAYFDLYQKAFAYASGLISVSHDMVDALKQLGAPAGKITWCPCGVDTAAFPLIDISNNGPNFISIGRFVEKKSPASVIKAFQLVANKIPEAKLVMVGNGPLFEESQNLVKELQLENKITLTGVLKPNEIRELMASSRCFVQHSVTAQSGDKEGTPVTILEASSSGLAVVSTLHTGIKDAVINGETGYLVPEHDIEQMAERMIAIASSVDLAVKLGKAARQHIINVYDFKQRIPVLDNVISGSINKHVG
jgi:colanic acid/amylovoran biosynthesis glycosyltransferase